ncbi:hypothetical protein PILCRDRAFT_822201 [Piloderma croceum F 1598]|uniref:Uncharacterized protein n=1 Tax=Piloderma croceum (strain F 1598) TaxID=765440 RepID=A0A0C3FNW0_PILCF|nr:hypothetical protein PILCRDRAFT_822201 [Piloderma croceum F 1598]
MTLFLSGHESVIYPLLRTQLFCNSNGRGIAYHVHINATHVHKTIGHESFCVTPFQYSICSANGVYCQVIDITHFRIRQDQARIDNDTSIRMIYYSRGLVRKSWLRVINQGSTSRRSPPEESEEEQTISKRGSKIWDRSLVNGRCRLALSTEIELISNAWAKL